MSLSTQKTTTTFILLFLGVVFIQSIRSHRQYSLQNLQAMQIATKSKGNPKAPIHIIEYLDFQCSHCTEGAQIIDSFFKNHSEKFYLEAHYFPLKRGTPHAFEAARFAYCAAEQNQFWAVYDQLLAQQNLWTQHEPESLGILFKSITEAIPLNKKGLDTCLADNTAETVIQRDIEAGKQLGVESTPTYFINGERVIGVTALRKKLEELLRDKGE